jgi:hypothetical protein
MSNNEKQQCAIIFLVKEQQIKVYVNIINTKFSVVMNFIPPSILYQMYLLDFKILPWKYALSEKQICRLFTYGLFYIANDEQQLKDYRKRVNIISFGKSQQELANGLLVLFNEFFTNAI